MTAKVMRTIIVVLVLSLLTTGMVLAKGAPSKVTISGPGLPGEVEITDPKLLQAFSFFQFENIEQRIETPSEPGEGYVVTRYVENGAKLIPWDRAIYYPRRTDELGVVFLEGLIGPSSSQFDGYWYRASQEGDTAMRQILAEHLATPVQATSWPTLSQIIPMAIFAFGLMALVALMGVAVRARRALTRGR